MRYGWVKLASEKVVTRWRVYNFLFRLVWRPEKLYVFYFGRGSQLTFSVSCNFFSENAYTLLWSWRRASNKVNEDNSFFFEIPILPLSFYWDNNLLQEILKMEKPWLILPSSVLVLHPLSSIAIAQKEAPLPIYMPWAPPSIFYSLDKSPCLLPIATTSNYLVRSSWIPL